MSFGRLSHRQAHDQQRRGSSGRYTWGGRAAAEPSPGGGARRAEGRRASRGRGWGQGGRKGGGGAVARGRERRSRRPGAGEEEPTPGAGEEEPSPGAGPGGGRAPAEPTPA